MAANSENSSRPSLESFRLCVQSICPKFNVSSLKESQFQALYSFICGEEVFVNLPTGSGKSLIFQLAPLVHTWMHEHILSTGDLRHQYGIFGGESQTSLFPFRSLLRDVNERRLYSQANWSTTKKEISKKHICFTHLVCPSRVSNDTSANCKNNILNNKYVNCHFPKFRREHPNQL